MGVDSMTTKKSILIGTVLCGVLVGGGVLFAQRPVENIDPHRHPNLAEAQHHLIAAYAKTEEAQKENKDELGGHAQKAKELMEAADRELKEAAEFANHRH
jgi:hypothetical protein